MSKRQSAPQPHQIRTLEETADVRARFLEELARCGSPRHACAVVGLARATAFTWRRKDKAFAQAWDEAKEVGIEQLLVKMNEIARGGITRKVLDDEGKVVRLEVTDDPRSIQWLLACLDPDRFGNRDKVEVSVTLNLAERHERARIMRQSKPTEDVVDVEPRS